MGRLITKATDRLSLFTAPATLDRTYNLEPETYVRVLDQVRGSVPWVVLDLPHIWSGWMRRTLIAADEVVVLKELLGTCGPSSPAGGSCPSPPAPGS